MPVELIFILIFLLAFVILIIFIGILYSVIKSNASKQKKDVLEFWQKLADTFGFQVTPEALLYGKYNYHDVEVIYDRVCIQRPIMNRESSGTILWCLCCTVKFPHPLNLSLNLQSPKALPKDSDPNNIIIGNPAFDSRFDATCFNQEILQKLLLNKYSSENKNLLSEILQANHYIETANYNEIVALLDQTPKHIRGLVMRLTYHLFIITDTDITIKIKSDFDDISEQSIKQILDQTTYIAKKIYTARLTMN
jgi:hypothetical protein